MNTMPRTKIDFSKITGPYPLLGVFLIVVEGLLGFWLFRAESAIERIVVGFLMTLLLGGFLLVVSRVVMRARKQEVSEGIETQGLPDRVTPGEKDATEAEIESPQPEAIAAPDGSFIINKPPEDWIVQTLTWADWINELFKITDPSLKEELCGTSSQAAEILAFRLTRETSVIPIPGRTIGDGRKLPSALEVLLPTRLAILPMDRAQPPLFVQRSLTHNFFGLVGEFLRMGLITLHKVSAGIIPNSQRPYLLAELRQEIGDAIVNGKEGKNINSNVTLIGIEGDLRDYLLIMNYPSLPAVDDPELGQDLETMRSLINSFRPLRILNPEEKLTEMKNMADLEFKKLMMKQGKKFFDAEFGILLFRLRDWDLNDPEKRLKVIKMLKPFEIFAKQVNYDDEDLDALWDSVHRAEEGDASSFKAQLSEIINAISDEQESDQEDSGALSSNNDEGEDDLNETEGNK